MKESFDVNIRDIHFCTGDYNDWPDDEEKYC